jgi:diaminobutyrate-2-oxoglutarate transaminase
MRSDASAKEANTSETQSAETRAVYGKPTGRQSAAGSVEGPNSMSAFLDLESNVRNYSRSFPVVFTSARGPHLMDENNRRYIDFLSGAGALNYGHNNPHLKRALLKYIADDGVTMSLDMATAVKRDFIKTFESLILQPRGLSYRLQFTGPTGAHAVEAAIALARKATGRNGLIAFTNGFHGMTQGALSVSANRYYRNSRTRTGDVTFLPYDHYADDLDSMVYIEACLDDPGSGIDPPAAFVVETVQGEGGVNVSSTEWLRRLAGLARRIGSLLIVDEVQAGCGRTGTFFSFERAGITPDLVCLSKSISGYGLPMALTLIRPDIDVWKPGEHSGTFRGNNLAFVTATAALDCYWHDLGFANDVVRKSENVRQRLQSIVTTANGLGRNSSPISVRSCGMMLGINCQERELASAISRAAFGRGLIIETCGNRDQVVKLLPPLTINDDELKEGIDILERAVLDCTELQVEASEASTK